MSERFASDQSHNADESSYDPERSVSSETKTPIEKTSTGISSDLETWVKEALSLAQDMVNSASNVSRREEREAVSDKVTAWRKKKPAIFNT